MNVEEFDYDLPESLIAQTPLKDRDQSRLLVLGRNSGNIEHKHFKDVINYLETGDTLVLNDTRVMPARLFGLKEETGAKVEMLMLTRIENNDWEVLLKPQSELKWGISCLSERVRLYECIENWIKVDVSCVCIMRNS